VFVFCRKTEFKTFFCNKKVTSLRKTGQRAYENISNFIEARNNDGTCPYNKATYSSELCEKLLNIYAKENDVVYDPYMGTGTTAIGAIRCNCTFIGSEIDDKQVEYANNRIKNERE
jgi:DNA modification methylase